MSIEQQSNLWFFLKLQPESCILKNYKGIHIGTLSLKVTQKIIKNSFLTLTNFG